MRVSFLPLLIVLVWAAPAFAQTRLEWNVNPESDVIGYTVYQGPAPGQYPTVTPVTGRTNTSLAVVPDPLITLYLAVQARSATAVSPLSSVVALAPAGQPQPPATSPDGTTVPPAPSLVDVNHDTWTLGQPAGPNTSLAVLKNGVQVGGAFGRKILWCGQMISVIGDGLPDAYYQWNGTAFALLGAASPCAAVPSPTPIPPTPMPPTPTPVPPSVNCPATHPSSAISDYTSKLTLGQTAQVTFTLNAVTGRNITLIAVQLGLDRFDVPTTNGLSIGKLFFKPKAIGVFPFNLLLTDSAGCTDASVKPRTVRVQ